MMDLLALLGLAAFVLVSSIVGMRILVLAATTRGLPETLIGLSLVLAGGVGTGLVVLPALWPDLDASAARVVY